MGVITIRLLPAKSSGIYPLDIEMCARWLLSGSPGKRGQSHLEVIRRVAELADDRIVFSGRKDYGAGEILELIGEDGELVGEDPRPTLDPISTL